MSPTFKQAVFMASALFFVSNAVHAQTVTWNGQVFVIDTLASNLGYPWEVTYGPDDSLWVTESRGYKITKIHTGNGGKRTILNLQSLKNFSRPDMTGGQWPQGGLMGLALHPQLLTGKPYVYVAYVYQFDNCLAGNNGCFFRTRVVRYTYNPSSGTLSSPVTLLNNLPGSNDHNSGRMTIGPDMKLYYTIGDMGAGQFNNLNRTNNAQNLNVLEGKVLRLNLEPDAGQSGGDEWIPDDNPFPPAAPATDKTPVFTYGHRNPQGLAWGNVGGIWRLYSSEHGDKSDDEVNVLEAGKNYGWPKVAGLCDDNYNRYDPYSANNKLANQDIDSEIADWCNTNPTQEPIFAMFNWTGAQIQTTTSNIFTWPTVAPSSIDFYGSYPRTIPGWTNSLLVTSLKHGLFRLKLVNSDGSRIDSNSTAFTTDTIAYFKGNRVRDIAISPHGDTIFFAIDSSGSTSGPTGGFDGTTVVNTVNAGRILRAVYLETLPIREHFPNQPVNNRTVIKVYPNPATQFLYVQTKRGLQKPYRVEMMDMAGKVVQRYVTEKDNFSLDVGHLTKGIYLFRMYSGLGIPVTTEKIVLQ